MGSRTGFAGPIPVEAARKSRLGELVEMLLVALLFLVFARTFVLEQARIPSGSMADTVLEGDYLLINRFVFAAAGSPWERAWLPLRPVRRGDVVVFAHPDTPEQEMIKRVIALPGERVAMREGTILIDGRPLDEPYVNPLYLPREGFAAREVEPGRLFVLGDHRNRSVDSRSWGTLPRSLVRGRAFIVLLSTRSGSAPDSTVGRLRDLVFRGRFDRSLSLIR